LKLEGNLGPQGQRFWLKLDAPSNMPNIFVTELTFQFEMLELKLDAASNMLSIVVTELTFQFEMSELKVFLL
jgi:hypothetical protein